MPHKRSTVEYPDSIPKELPQGKALVHNLRVDPRHPNRRQGQRGFRFFLVDAVEMRDKKPCDCGWAPNLPVHYGPDS